MASTIQFSVDLSLNVFQKHLDDFQSIVDKGGLVCDRVAFQSLERLMSATPVRYSGHVKSAWRHRAVSPMVHVNENKHKVMRFLEDGTKAHGPKNARALFVPLNERSSKAGPRGVMAANAAARAGGALARYGAAASNGRYAAPAISYPFVFGVDFLWAKRVRGIRARHIARDEQKVVGTELRNQLKTMLTDHFK